MRVMLFASFLEHDLVRKPVPLFGVMLLFEA